MNNEESQTRRYTREDIQKAKQAMLSTLANLSGGALIPGCCTQGCCDPDVHAWVTEALKEGR